MPRCSATACTCASSLAALQSALDRLSQTIPAAGGQLNQARPIPPGLEDVFIALLEENEAAS